MQFIGKVALDVLYLLLENILLHSEVRTQLYPKPPDEIYQSNKVKN
jgi:hypothetical protein